MKKSLILINERSGALSAIGAAQCLDALTQVITGPYEVEIASGDPSRLVDAARAALSSNTIENIYLAGGDGTCAAVSGVLAGSNIALTPLPGGTMNAFARDLGYDADLLTAISQVSTARERLIDIAFIGEYAFLNNIVFGAYTAVAESREHLREADGVGEILESVAEIAGTLVHVDKERYKIIIDDETRQIQTNTIMIANNVYDGADQLRPTRTLLDQGLLGCYVANSTSAIDFVTVLIDAVTGKIAESELIAFSACKACKIDCESGILAVSIDGEAVELASPVDIRIAPAALRVWAPIAAA